MHHGLLAAEDPMKAVRALDAHARLVRGHHFGLAQGGQGRLTPGLEARLGTAQHVHEPALAHREAEQVEERLLQALIRERLEGLQVPRRARWR